jgi:hypothetical protein
MDNFQTTTPIVGRDATTATSAAPPPGPPVPDDATTGEIELRLPFRQAGSAETHRLRLITVNPQRDDADWLARHFESIQAQPTHTPTKTRTVLLTFQGVQILWRRDQVIIDAPADRVERVSLAIIDATTHELTLESLESEVDSHWDDVRSDAPLAFEFHERAVPRREQLFHRFQSLVEARVAYAKLVPQIIVPYVHPPTLTSQIGERLRERLRMPERLELLDQKLAAQERVYELCSHRVSEFMVARKGHQLEWVIILLLLMQSVLLLVEYLGTTSV